MNNPQIHFVREVIVGKRDLGRPQLRYRNLCKRDMKELEIAQWAETGGQAVFDFFGDRNIEPSVINNCVELDVLFSKLFLFFSFSKYFKSYVTLSAAKLCYFQFNNHSKNAT